MTEFFNMLYITPSNAVDSRATYEAAAEFLMAHRFEIDCAIGIMGRNATHNICELSETSPIGRFFHSIGAGYSGLRIMLQVADGWASEEPFLYLSHPGGLESLSHYYVDLKRWLGDRGWQQPIGLVFGESMGGKPMLNTDTHVQRVRDSLRARMNHAGLPIEEKIFIGASPGGCDEMDAWYKQKYDWTKHDRNPWIEHKGQPERLFAALKEIAQHKRSQGVYSDIEDWCLGRDPRREWLFHAPGKHEKKEFWMFAFDVPGKDDVRQPRLQNWSLTDMTKFCEFVRNGRTDGDAPKLALYFGFESPRPVEALRAREAWFQEAALVPTPTHVSTSAAARAPARAPAPAPIAPTHFPATAIARVSAPEPTPASSSLTPPRFKIVILFLVEDRHRHPSEWRRLFDAYPGTFSVFFHQYKEASFDIDAKLFSTPERFYNERSVSKRIAGSESARYHYSMTKVMLLLLREAIEASPPNSYFLFASESCIPMTAEEYVNRLIRLSDNGTRSVYRTSTGGCLRAEALGRQTIRNLPITVYKHSQWGGYCYNDAEIIVSLEAELDRINEAVVFRRRRDRVSGPERWVPDEHLFGSVLMSFGHIPSQMNITYTEWNENPITDEDDRPVEFPNLTSALSRLSIGAPGEQCLHVRKVK